MIIARVLFWLLCFIALVYGQSSPDKATMIALRSSLKPGKLLNWSDPDPCFWTGVVACSSPDKATMIALRNSLKPGKLLNWSDPDPCVWTGVACDAESRRVIWIQIGEKGISGTLPSDLKGLSSLTAFEVWGNNITGKLPSLAGLHKLLSVYVNDNGFTSIDADFFTGLSSVQEVILDNNPLLPWEIPLSLKNAAYLRKFSAAKCGLSGKIPDLNWSRTFFNLRTLVLSGNSLQGELPMSFAGLYVKVLLVNGQKGNEKLNGSISVLQNMTHLTNVSLQGNGFSGPIPDLSGLVSLKMFIVSENQLTGVVPSTFTELESLSDVALGNNFLQGPTPSFKAESITLDMTGLNSFCLNTSGTPCDPRVNTLLSIVEAFGYPVRLAQSWKGNDPCDGKRKRMWVGITCSGADITMINLENMGLTGTISPRFADLTFVRVINLSQNNLTGTIPQELAKLSNLTSLDVSNNHLCGQVPYFGLVVANMTGNPDMGKDCLLPVPGPQGSSSGISGKKATSHAGSLLLVTLILKLLFGLL